jgi:hypothetical protein
VSDPSELAFYRCYATGAVTLAELVRVAGSRWSIEETFQATKNEVGLDHYQVRLRVAWYRHITLAMVARAHLDLLAAAQPAGPPPDPPPPALTSQTSSQTGQGRPWTRHTGGRRPVDNHPATRTRVTNRSSTVTSTQPTPRNSSR